MIESMAIKRTIDVAILSAKDLKRVKNFGQQTCYAVVYIHPAQMFVTKVDKDGGVNPTWNSKVTLTCSESVLYRPGSAITVEIYNYSFFYNKLVGTAIIPLRDHLANEGKDETKLLAIEVKRSSNKVQGVLNMAVKLGAKSISPTRDEAVVVGYPVTGYPLHYPPQGYDRQSNSQYPPQQYYRDSQQSYNSRPTRRQRGPGALVGGLVGGLLLGGLVGGF